jgi:hypothetical protein
MTPDLARELFSYDDKTGQLFWKSHPSLGRLVGREACRPSLKGYFFISFKGKVLLAHRIVWMVAYGEIPNGMIDHANGDGRDNRLENLRLATRSQNAFNSRQTRALSGVRGVRATRSGTFEAAIKNNNRSIHLGTFKSLDAASAAYRSAAIEIYGEFVPAQ